jgi:hypothetical protein
LTLQTNTSPWPSRLFNLFCGLYFLVIGLAIALVLLNSGAPSFWFLPAALLFALSGLLFFRPRIAASFALLFPLVFLGLLLYLKPWSWPAARGKGFSLAFILLLCLGLCLVQIRRHGLATLALVSAALALLVCYGVDRTFTNRLHITTHTMDRTADGTTPWGDPPTPDPTGQFPVLIYTVVPNGYCYETVYSDDLRKHLLALHKPSIKVDYNEFTTFGSPAGYNIHAVEGLVLNDGRHAVLPIRASYGNTMVIPTPGKPTSYQVNCPR